MRSKGPLQLLGHKSCGGDLPGHRLRGESGLQGVQPSGLPPPAAGSKVDHLRLRPGAGRKDRGEGDDVQDGPGGDGPVSGGAPGGDAGGPADL